MASGAPVNLTGEYGIPCKHWNLAPQRTSPGIRHPLQTLGVCAPANLTGEYGIPCKHWAFVPQRTSPGNTASSANIGHMVPQQTSPGNSATPANIGHLCPSELHRVIQHPLQTLGICVRRPLQTLGIWYPSERHWPMGNTAPPTNIGHLCPSELHWGMQHPLQTAAVGIWCPSELHLGIRHPLHKVPNGTIKLHKINGILSLRRSSYCTQHIYHQAKLCPG